MAYRRKAAARRSSYGARTARPSRRRAAPARNGSRGKRASVGGRQTVRLEIVTTEATGVSRPSLAALNPAFLAANKKRRAKF